MGPKKKSGGGTDKKGGRGKKRPGADDPPPHASDALETEVTDTAAEKDAAKSSKDKDSRAKSLKPKVSAVTSSNTSASLRFSPLQSEDDSNSDTDAHSQNGQKSATSTPVATPLKEQKERAERVTLTEAQELELFQWLPTMPQIWNRNREFQNYKRADKLILWQQVAERYGKTGQFF